MFLFDFLERRAARDLIVPETGEDIDGCVRVCVCVRVGGAGEAKSKDNTYNQWMTCKVFRFLCLMIS